MASELDRAIAIAVELHENQTDKAGQPYVLHPLRVMLAMESDVERIIAVLHDVAEDDELGWQAVHDGGFEPEIIEAIDAITRREDEGYFDYIRRAGSNPLARKVKIADLADNLSETRVSSCPPKLMARYIKAGQILQAEPTGGEPS